MLSDVSVGRERFSKPQSQTRRLSQSYTNLLAEEQNLELRKHRAARARTRTSKSSRDYDQEINLVLNQYKNKLCLYVIDEINAAVKALEASECSSDSEIGLCIDDHDEDKAHETEAENFDEAEDIIKSLFCQISSRVPEKISSKLGLSSETFFFELLSSSFGSDEFSTFVEDTFLFKCKRLFCIETFAALYSLLFYRFAFKIKPATHDFKKLSNFFLKGATQILNHDLQQRTRRLFALYSYARAKVPRIPQSGEIEQVQQLKLLLVRFYYYYGSSSVEETEKFLEDLDFAIDDFLNETIAFSQKLEDSKIQSHYLRSIGKLTKIRNFDRVQPQTLQKLGSFLNHLAFSGSEETKSAAIECLDAVFPSTKLSRKLINGVFKLWKPQFLKKEVESAAVFAAEVSLSPWKSLTDKFSLI